MPYDSIERSFEAADFDTIAGRTRDSLAAEGFGVVSEIDVNATMKAKLGIDSGGYLILGACSSQMVVEAARTDPSTGVMLPCNVILRRTGPGAVEVSAYNPVAIPVPAGAETLSRFANTVHEKLAKAISRI